MAGIDQWEKTSQILREYLLTPSGQAACAGEPTLALPNEPDPDNDSEFVALLTEHQSALRLYVASLLPGETSAADVAQQANATIWKKRADFELGTNFKVKAWIFKAWIFSIARYEVLNFRKKQAKESRFVFSDELENLIVEELPAQDHDLEERHRRLRFCLSKLRPADRNLIEHRYFKAQPLQDYADGVGRSVNSLKVTLHRLRNRLQRRIESQLSVSKEVEA